MKLITPLLILLITSCSPDAPDSPEIDHHPDAERIITDLLVAVQVYDDNNGSYPPSGIGNLKESLLEDGPEGTPYHQFKDGSTLDPWGQPWIYINNVDGTAPSDWPRFESYVIYSRGPDGSDELGEGDDVASWNLN